VSGSNNDEPTQKPQGPAPCGYPRPKKYSVLKSPCCSAYKRLLPKMRARNITVDIQPKHQTMIGIIPAGWVSLPKLELFVSVIKV
jgi:hypothetical protein